MENLAIGVHEVQKDVSSSEAGGSILPFYGCGKNRESPGYHDRFIPVYEFGVDNLPALPPGLNGAIGKDEIVDWVKSCIPLVVRINVGLISKARPDKWQDQSSYPFAEYKGREVNNVGSGYIQYVDGPYTCSSFKGCGRCSVRENTEDTCWRVVILTARHLVFDSTEARETKVNCFDEHPDKSGVMTLVGGKVREADTERDYCWLTCFTHDNILAERLDYLCKQRSQIYEHLYELLEECDDVIGLPVIAISHPHGRMKYVSVGRLSDELERKRKAVYTTPTCPGSSGGVILEVCGRYVEEGLQQQRQSKVWLGWFKSYLHSGASKNGTIYVGYSADWLYAL